MEKKCPYCGAETRPGDNYCLNCGNPLPASTPSSAGQAQPAAGEATVASPEEWPPVSGASQASDWPAPASAAASGPAEQYNYQPGSIAPTVQAATMDRIEQPARLLLRADNGDIVQEFSLDKPEMTIGRAQSSDILLSKDKLTSRRHATIQYENGQYLIRDEHSANGTFVNGQQIEEMVPHKLQDGDHVGIGEHELIFHAFSSPSQDIDSMPTIAAPFEAAQPDGLATVPAQSEDDFKTRESVQEASAAKENPPMPEAPQATPVVAEEVPPLVPASTPDVPETPAPGDVVPERITLSQLTSLEQPALPDMSALMAALSTLDGQIASLQNDFNATQGALRKHQEDVEQVTGQVRASLRHVTERMDKTIADVARSREAVGWSELNQLMEDVMNNPRDVEYIIKLARKSRELNKIFQLHQNVLNAMAECNSLLRALIGDE